MENSPSVTQDSTTEEPAAIEIAWLSVAEVADRLGVSVGRVQSLRRERQLIAVRHEDALRIPAAFLAGDVIVKHLPGVLTLLADGGFSDEESIDWLFTAEASLPGTPIQALHDNRATEVKRRAQASAL